MRFMTAKRGPGFRVGADTWWRGFVHLLQAWKPDFLTGDFNVSLWEVAPRVRVFDPSVDVVLATAFGWRMVADAAAAIEEREEDDEVANVEVILLPGSGKNEATVGAANW